MQRTSSTMQRYLAIPFVFFLSLSCAQFNLNNHGISVKETGSCRQFDSDPTYRLQMRACRRSPVYVHMLRLTLHSVESCMLICKPDDSHLRSTLNTPLSLEILWRHEKPVFLHGRRGRRSVVSIGRL